MRRRIVLVSAVGAMLGAVAVVWVPAAAADVVTPPGACVGSATWKAGGFSAVTTDHAPGDVIKIPQKDDVKWAGNEKGFALGAEGPRRDIDGSVQLELPGNQAVTIDSWGGSSVRYANTDTHSYDLPDVLIGVKMKVSGSMALAGIGGAVVFGVMLVLAGRPKFKKVGPAYEDVNPG